MARTYSHTSRTHRGLYINAGQRGDDIKALQRAINARLEARGIGYNHPIAVDGEYGPKTHAAALTALFYLGLTRASVRMAKNGKTRLSEVAQDYLRLATKRNRWQLARADRRLKAYRKKQAMVPLRERAYRQAASQVGVMESGPNNAGTPFERYEKPNGAAVPEPWCGDFMAWCYRQAGSKAVQRLWASVYFLGRIAGLHKVTNPERGDLVRFSFDHVGMFVRDLGGGYIETIEGNTGASGAVSDSSTGGDGVYRKHRSKSLVQDYLRVER